MKNFNEIVNAIRAFLPGGKFQVRDPKTGKVVHTANSMRDARDWAYAKWGRTKESYNSVSEAPAKPKARAGETRNLTAARISRERDSKKALVLRADRTAEGTAKPTNYGKQFSKHGTFSEAYNSALGRGDYYFDYKGKVYTLDKNDLEGIRKAGRNINDNRADMEARFGKYLGWSKDPNFGKSSVKHTTDVKNASLGNLTVEEAIASNPADPVEYNSGNIRNHAWGELNPDDVANMWYGIGAGTAATALAPMALMEVAPGVMYNTATGVQTVADGTSWAGREAWKGAKDAVSGLRQGNLLGDNSISQGAGNYANYGSEFIGDVARNSINSPKPFLKHIPNPISRPSGPYIPANAASKIQQFGEGIGYAVDGTGLGIVGTGLLLKKGGILKNKYIFNN